MIVLDTNVVSEFFRPRPDEAVVDWVRGLEGEVALTAITVAELLAGLEALPEGRRRRALTQAVHSALLPYRGSSAILPFDDLAAEHYAQVLASRRRAGSPISTADAQTAAICRVAGAELATRNTADFADTGVQVVDPWTRGRAQWRG